MELNIFDTIVSDDDDNKDIRQPLASTRQMTQQHTSLHDMQVPFQAAAGIQAIQRNLESARGLANYYTQLATYYQTILFHHAQKRKAETQMPSMDQPSRKRRCLSKVLPEGEKLYTRSLNCDGDWAISKLYGLRDYTCVSTHTKPGFWYALRINSSLKFRIRPPPHLLQGHTKLDGGRIWGFIKLEECDVSDEDLKELGLDALATARSRCTKTGRYTQKVMKIVNRQVLTRETSILVTPKVYNYKYTSCVGGLCMDRIALRDDETVTMFDCVNKAFEELMKPNDVHDGQLLA